MFLKWFCSKFIFLYVENIGKFRSHNIANNNKWNEWDQSKDCDQYMTSSIWTIDRHQKKLQGYYSG